MQIEREKEKKRVRGIYRCNNPGCDKIYTWKNSLWQHQKYACGSLKPRFKCIYCGKASKIRSNVKRHIIHVHKGKKIQIIDLLR